MRFPHENENLIGKVCVSSIGRPFIVTDKGRLLTTDPPRGSTRVWQGLGLDGKGTACSTAPVVVAESGQEFRDKLAKRFGGKMSHND